MRLTRHRLQPFSTVGRAAKSLPLAVLGIAGLALWQNRERIGGLVRDLADRLTNGGEGGQPAPREVIPDDYDYNRPSVFNSTAMAGPVNGAGEPRSIDGGSMGTDLGTRGEGAL